MFDLKLKRARRERDLADAVVAEFVAVPIGLIPPAREVMADAFGRACVKMGYAPDDAAATKRILDNVSEQIARLRRYAEGVADASAAFDRALDRHAEACRS